jgi:hypothetical protein
MMKRFLKLGITAIVLVGCSGNDQLAEQIQQDIVANGGTSVKAVTCPGGSRPEPGQSFECVGEMDNGYTFTITVQAQDNNGTFTWDVPHAKGLVNIPKLESEIQENLSTEVGTKPTVTCGGVYKAVKPGEGFECRLTYKIANPAPKSGNSAKGKAAPTPPPIEVTQTEKVNVTTDDSGNISWQRLPPKLAAKPTT